jgi:hypothetical protein
MRKTAYIVLSGSTVLTFLFMIIWIAGFVYAPATLGRQIHLLLILSIISAVGVVVGVILLIVSLVKKGL